MKGMVGALSSDLMTLETQTSVRAPAKVNLTLEVLGRRPDGFHELRSLVIGVDLCDRIGCWGQTERGIELSSSDPALCGPQNLAFKAAEKLAERVGREPALRIEVQKAIPVGAGLGGGSSDAAATLRLCNHLWGDLLDDRQLALLGAEIGSDVPLFFSLPSAVMSGRGELVEPLSLSWSGWVLLVFAGPAVSTRVVYHAWRPADAQPCASRTEERIAAASSAGELTGLLYNQLEPAVLRVSPAVAQTRADLERLGVGPMRVSGAGSTLYRLFDEKQAACRIADEVVNRGIGAAATVVACPVGPSPLVNEEY